MIGDDNREAVEYYDGENQGLYQQIPGSFRNIQKNLSDVQNSLSDFQKAIGRMGGAFSQVTPALRRAQQLHVPDNPFDGGPRELSRVERRARAQRRKAQHASRKNNRRKK